MVKQLLNLCSRMIILWSLKRKAKAWGVKHFFVQNVQNRFTCEARGLQWTCRYVRWIFWVLKVVGKVPCSQLAPCLSLNLQICCSCLEAPLNSEECLSQHLWESSQWGFLSRVRPSEVPEPQWKQRQSWKTTEQEASARISLSVYATLHSISLSEDAAPSLSCKAHTEMDQEDKIWRYGNTGVYVTLQSEMCISSPTYSINPANK